MTTVTEALQIANNLSRNNCLDQAILLQPDLAIAHNYLGLAIKLKGPIVIGDGAWLGCGVTVLQGVHIGKGAVIGAGSVVLHDIPDGAIAVGSPARVVKMRAHLN